MRDALASSARQHWQQVVLAADQRFLLLTPPSLDLPLRGDRIDEAIEFLMVDDLHRPAGGGVSAEDTAIVFCYPTLEARPCGADVIGTIGAAQDIKIGAQ